MPRSPSRHLMLSLPSLVRVAEASPPASSSRSRTWSPDQRFSSAEERLVPAREAPNHAMPSPTDATTYVARLQLCIQRTGTKSCDRPAR